MAISSLNSVMMKKEKIPEVMHSQQLSIATGKMINFRQTGP